MESFDDVKTRLMDDGFKEDGENTLTYERKSYSTVSVNGRVSRKENMDRISIVYNGVGGTMVDDSECLDDMMFFDVLHNGEQVASVGVGGYDDLMEMINLK